jgi:hypothetical protein
LSEHQKDYFLHGLLLLVKHFIKLALMIMGWINFVYQLIIVSFLPFTDTRYHLFDPVREPAIGKAWPLPPSLKGEAACYLRRERSETPGATLPPALVRR